MNTHEQEIYNQAIKDAANIARQIERNEFDLVGHPLIKEPSYAITKSILKLLK